MDHLWFLCLVFLMLSRMFIDALWWPAGKRLTSLLLLVMFFCIFVTFPCGILGQVWYFIVSFPDLCLLFYFYLYAFFLHSYFYFIWFTIMYVPNSWLTEGSEQFSRAPFSAVFDRRNNHWISLLSIRSPVSWSNQVVVLVFLCPDPVAPLAVVVLQRSLHIIHLKLYYNLEYLPAHSILVHITYACITTI